MHYPHQTRQLQYKQDSRLTKLREENLQLQKALKQLNQCYQQKILLLEQSLKESKKKEEALLEWKSNYINKELFNNSKYQQELQKLVSIIESMAQNYQLQHSQFEHQIQQKNQEITLLKNQIADLRQEKDAQQQKVSELAHRYIVQIERLNNELKDLKEQINYDEEHQHQKIYHPEAKPAFFDPETSSRQQKCINSITQSIYEQHLIDSQEISQHSKIDENRVLKDISNQNVQNSPLKQKQTFLNEF